MATNAIGECTIDVSKKNNVISQRPSRANLTPKAQSGIFSKLDGENKVLFIDEHFQYVVSTVFFNIETLCLDQLLGFILSNDFKKKKSLLATGTTMVGLNNSSLSKIIIRTFKKIK